jgi:hypothetical protein
MDVILFKRVTSISLYNRTVFRYVQRQHGIHFTELAADFIKDVDGAWWFLQVKAFRIAPETLALFRKVLYFFTSFVLCYLYLFIS